MKQMIAMITCILLLFSSYTEFIIGFVFFIFPLRDNDDSTSREEIIEYVTDHQSALQGLVEDIDFWKMSNEERYKAVKEQLGDETIIQGVAQMMAREDVLIFQCGGSGMAASASTYTDFYYSAGDLLYAPLENTYGDELTEVEPGIYEWSNDSCLLHIEKITDGWYYLYEEFL